MIFKQIDEILSGKKTQTRRVERVDYAYSYYAPNGLDHIHTIYLWNEDGTDFRKYLYIGQTHAIVPKRGAKSIPDGRIRILDIRQERLHAITEADARAEGVGSISEYRELWESINGKSKHYRWDANPYVNVITFQFEKAAQP